MTGQEPALLAAQPRGQAQRPGPTKPKVLLAGETTLPGPLEQETRTPRHHHPQPQPSISIFSEPQSRDGHVDASPRRPQQPRRPWTKATPCPLSSSPTQ